MIRLDINDKDVAIRVVATEFPITLTGRRTGHRWTLFASFEGHTVAVKSKITLATLRTIAQDVVDGKLSATSAEFKDLYEYHLLAEKWPAILGDIFRQAQTGLYALSRYQGVSPSDWLNVADRTLQSVHDRVEEAANAHFGRLAYLWMITVYEPKSPEDSAFQSVA